MANIATTYMGVKLRNPIIAGASGLTSSVEAVQRLEQAGVGAVVVKSLFEEQVTFDEFAFDEEAHRTDSRYAEMLTMLPHLRYDGPGDYAMRLKAIRKVVRIPVFASLNCTRRDTWLDYARRLEDAGIDGLECNFFASPGERSEPGHVIETEHVETVRQLAQTLSVPVAAKLSPLYTNALDVIRRMDASNVAAIVLFNRLFEPDIDIESERHFGSFNLSHPTDYRLPLRYIGLLEGTVRADLCASTGISNGEHVVKMLLAGACCVQIVSGLLRYGFEHVHAMLDDLTQWMDRKHCASLEDFRGRLSRRHLADPWAYSRGQYLRVVTDRGVLTGNVPDLWRDLPFSEPERAVPVGAEAEGSGGA